jgi:manganese/iron transport system permease protein/iron/zinc/copper transport system permease protein
MTGVFLLTLTFAPRYGLLADWLRRRNSVPQEMMEDVLGAILRARGTLVPISEIVRNLSDPFGRIRRAITMLAKQDLLEIESGQVRLTDDGRVEAVRLVRAHRLWESYLEKTGTPETELHEKAHVLEHMSDQATIDYLDDHLGHPITDPHGTVIPTDVSQQKADRDFMLSLLREGNVAVVQRVNQAGESAGLKVGESIRMGARSNDGKVWRLLTPNGRQIELRHEQADAIIVRLRSK